MTPMQEFALEVLKENPAGTVGSYIGQRWQERDGRRAKLASRACFGATSAAYRSLRALVSHGLARVEHSKTTGGYSVETYFAV